MIRLSVFTYLALGVSLLLWVIFSPHHDRYLVRHSMLFVLGLVSPLAIVFARSVIVRWLGVVLLGIAVAGCTLLPELH